MNPNESTRSPFNVALLSALQMQGSEVFMLGIAIGVVGSAIRLTATKYDDLSKRTTGCCRLFSLNCESRRDGTLPRACCTCDGDDVLPCRRARLPGARGPTGATGASGL